MATSAIAATVIATAIVDVIVDFTALAIRKNKQVEVLHDLPVLAD